MFAEQKERPTSPVSFTTIVAMIEAEQRRLDALYAQVNPLFWLPNPLPDKSIQVKPAEKTFLRKNKEKDDAIRKRKAEFHKRHGIVSRYARRGRRAEFRNPKKSNINCPDVCPGVIVKPGPSSEPKVGTTQEQPPKTLTFEEHFDAMFKMLENVTISFKTTATTEPVDLIGNAMSTSMPKLDFSVIQNPNTDQFEDFEKQMAALSLDQKQDGKVVAKRCLKKKFRFL